VHAQIFACCRPASLPPHARRLGVPRARQGSHMLLLRLPFSSSLPFVLPDLPIPWLHFGHAHTALRPPAQPHFWAAARLPAAGAQTDQTHCPRQQAQPSYTISGGPQSPNSWVLPVLVYLQDLVYLQAVSRRNNAQGMKVSTRTFLGPELLRARPPPLPVRCLPQ
jgi:hypothetical protein